MTIYCLYSDSSGRAQVRTLAPVTVDDDPLRLAIGLATATATILFSGTPRHGKWHTTPHLGLTVVLDGYLKIETNRRAPEAVIVQKGDALFVLDNSGEGHRSEASDKLSALLLPLTPDAISHFTELFPDWPRDLTLENA